MTDYFALLEQPRRPWQDPERLEEKYHELARTFHPDASDSSAFGEMTAAYRTLRDPKTRLQHLLTLEGKASANASTEIPGDLVDLFMEIVPALKSRNRNAITLLSGRVEHALDLATQQLRELDGRWSPDEFRLAKATSLYHRFSFLTRWREVLNETALANSTL